MKLVIEGTALRRLLTHVRGVVELRNTIPILGNVKLVAGDGVLSLAATDLDLEIVEQVPAAIDAGGATTVPAHTLHDIARKLPDGAQVEMQQADGERMTLRCGRSRFTLATLPADDFPVLAVRELPHRFSVPTAALHLLIDATRFAISTEETRYYLNGIYLHPAQAGEGPVLRAVATDGHRLARADVPLMPGGGGWPGVIVPRKTVAEVRKLAEGAGEVACAVSETQVRIALGEATLTSKLIDGTFPDYERVIPAHNEHHLDVDRATFGDAVERIAAISSDRSRAVKLTLAAGALELAADSAEHGSAREDLDARWTGPAMSIGFNARYLTEILDQMTGDTVRISMGDANGPVLLRQPGDEATMYVLMPMRVA